MFDPSRGYPSVVPYVRYRDPAAAIDWLTAVLGAHPAVRLVLPDGRIAHAELRSGDHVVAIGLAATARTTSPPPGRDDVCAMTLVFVPDVDAATARALQLGATLVDDATDMP
jgi:PhnB protein